ncbi:MAG: hypothetical protein KDC92_01130 [Bacteroidetes bacterium]|nr:hypothetical protein [Bacteroidota bacterium]
MASKKLFSEFNKSNFSEWQQKAIADLKDLPLEKLNRNAAGGIAALPYYSAEHNESNSSTNLLPNQFPYLRSHKTVSNGWLIREEIAAHKNFKATAAKLQDAIKNGAHNLVLAVKAFDDGFDGIPIENLEQLANLLENVDPQQTGISFKSGNLSPFYALLLGKWAKENGYTSNQVFGSIDFDPLSTFAVNGKPYKPLEGAFNDLAELLAKMNEALPLYKVLTIHSRTFHNAGATEVQELAFTLAMAHEYVHQMAERNLDFDAFFQQIQVELSFGSDYFVQIAKTRALRWLWSTMASEYTSNQENTGVYIVGKTSEWNKAVYDPYVNMLRSTTEGMSAVIGGVDELEIEPFDKSFRKPDSFSERIARNLHHLYQNESHLHSTVDAASGSYYIEELTSQLAQKAWEQFQLIEEKGGFVACLQSGYIQAELNANRKNSEEQLAKRKLNFIGVNQFPNKDDKATELVKPSSPRFPLPEISKEETEFASAWDAKTISGFAMHFEQANNENVAAVNHYVATEIFEQLRAGVEMKVAQGHKVPSVFLMQLGNKAMRTARAMFAANFYQVGGLEVHNPGGFEDVSKAVEAFKESKASILVFCSADDEYEAIIPQVTKQLKTLATRPQLVLAGHPKDKKEDYEDLGIEEFIFQGCNVYSILQHTINN